MVILVVTLLVLTIVFRSFDRAKNASNVRISQVALEAATPAVERATAKLDALFDDPQLPRATPSDTALYQLLGKVPTTPAEKQKSAYDFDDEVRLKLAYDFNGTGGIQEGGTLTLEQTETATTAWRFPVDTDNNGKFDSFTLYGILFRSPERGSTGFLNSRTPLDARTPPMNEGSGSDICVAALETSAGLVGEGGWYTSGDKLKKSFYVYTATVPITNLNVGGAPLNPATYEVSSKRGVAALEYQQDRARFPIANNAVVFEDDLAIVGGSQVFVNGSILANSNLFVAPAGSRGDIRLYHVSAPESCFYKEETGKITVGGQLINSAPLRRTNGNVQVHLFRDGAAADSNRKNFNNSQESINVSTGYPGKLLNNSQAYTQRINHLVKRTISLNKTMPDEVQRKIDAVPVAEQDREKIKALTAYFKDRTRRVAFVEVDPIALTSALKDPKGNGNTLRPPKDWMFPYDPSNGVTEANYSNVRLRIGSGLAEPPATEPQTLAAANQENEVGDRIQVGNNLPNKYYKIANYNAYDTDETGIFVGSGDRQQIGLNNSNGTGQIQWDIDTLNPDVARTRTTQVKSLADIGDKSRSGFWEVSAANPPRDPLEGYGGMRIITGAGVYERIYSFLPPPKPANPNPDAGKELLYDDPNTTAKEEYPVVWPDTMPMSPTLGSKVYDNFAGQWEQLTDDSNALLPIVNNAALTFDPTTRKYAKGDLRMRATAIYHYARNIYDQEFGDYHQRPIACVSSYYDPTNETTAGRTNVSVTKADNAAKSNNGYVYDATSGWPVITGALPGSNGLFTGGGGFDKLLREQANLVFPNGRYVNQPLREALIALNGTNTSAIATTNKLTLSQQSAIDSTICAFRILSNPGAVNTTFVPDNTIKETAFLDNRQIKAIDAGTSPDATTGIDLTEGGVTFRALGNSNNSLLTGNYDLPISQRQPMEVRVTQIDLDKLRNRAIPIANDGSFQTTANAPSPEYLLPNSGIIYASRDDGLRDISAPIEGTIAASGPTETQLAEQSSNSPVDYKLDPTRRPNGILLFNGRKLARNNSETFRAEEKGLIVATDLPAYVWSKTANNTSLSVFNEHTQEEFNTNLNLTAGGSLWSNFYTRGDNSNEADPQFACRPGDTRLPKCTIGDTWRPATVIADSVGLLSRNFRFGYRNEGDFDLRNNQNDAESMAKRLQNGFFDNNYVTNGLSSGGLTLQDKTSEDTSGPSRTPTDNDYLQLPTAGGNAVFSSYFTNFITPIQRRQNFDEYVMEVCPKFPVSECQPEDWGIGGYDANRSGFLERTNNILEASTFGTPVDLNNDGDTSDTFPETTNLTAAQLGQILDAGGTVEINRLGAGTTARPPLLPPNPVPPPNINTQGLGNRRFARRVAFKRRANNQLVLTDYSSGAVTPILLGRGGSNVAEFPYNATSHPDNTNNALWYRTTTNRSGQPYNNITYARESLLSYLQPQNEKEEFLLPDVADVARASTVATRLNGATPSGTPAIDTNDPADYAVCITGSNRSGSGELLPSGSGATSQKFLMQGTGDFGTGPCVDISAARTTLQSLATPTPIAFPAGSAISLPATTTTANLYIYNLPAGGVIPSGTTITLTGDSESIFIFRSAGSDPINFGNAATVGVKLILEGVNPNNVYWVTGGNMTFDAAATSPHQVVGNFLGTGALQISTETQIFGGRFLGFNGTPGNENYIEDGATIQAISNQNQPLLVPVLQIHSPTGTPAGGSTLSNPGLVNRTKWLQTAVSSTYNFIMAGGNTPGRDGEPDGGLANYPRYLEDWSRTGGSNTQNARINGSLMELGRSNYATAPFQPLKSITASAPFNYPQGYSTSNTSDRSQPLTGKIPYTQPPNRLYGFDVGLLSQLPDLFSSRFTSPSAGDPDEFFREVGRDDEWIQTLLCAKTAEAPNRLAVNNDQRPNSFCTSRSGG